MFHQDPRTGYDVWVFEDFIVVRVITKDNYINVEVSS